MSFGIFCSLVALANASIFDDPLVAALALKSLQSGPLECGAASCRTFGRGVNRKATRVLLVHHVLFFRVFTETSPRTKKRDNYPQGFKIRHGLNLSAMIVGAAFAPCNKYGYLPVRGFSMTRDRSSSKEHSQRQKRTTKKDVHNTAQNNRETHAACAM